MFLAFILNYWDESNSRENEHVIEPFVTPGVVRHLQPGAHLYFHSKHPLKARRKSEQVLVTFATYAQGKKVKPSESQPLHPQIWK